MAKTVLCSQAAADVIAERQRTADRSLAVVDDVDASLGMARICVLSAASGTLAERRDAMVRGAAWLLLASEEIDRRINARIREGVA